MKHLYEHNFCRGCGEKCSTVYCEDCAKDLKCPHGEKVEDCNACYVEGDLAFDANRERGG